MSSSEPEPKAEPRQTPESEPEPELVPNTSAEPRSDLECYSEPESVGEPLPEWSSAINEWGFAWEFYQYALGGIFILIGLLSLVLVVKLKTSHSFRQKKAHVVNLVLLILFGVTRGLSLCIDINHSRGISPRAAVNLLWGLGQPCIITAYTLVFVVLRNAMMLKQRFQNWYTNRNIALTTVPYFCFVFVAEITVAYVATKSWLTFACQLLYVLTSLLLLAFYTYIAVVLWKKLQGANGSPATRSRLRPIFTTCCAAIIGGTLLCATNIYGLCGVYGVFSTATSVAAWPWLWFNMVQRLLEIGLSLLLLWVLAQKDVSSSGNNEMASSSRHTGDDVIVVRTYKRAQHSLQTQSTRTESVN
ncbi:uncharacterized protein LOC116601926 [Nematostella vectensis]|uniref:uncharacterized protein LOC116601926 n=1 Tax=Nematostella vectensis TaxID=45351 RepID=UPI0020774A41|nr:uncharacterized protein LOC116601926 [Nematostella vectensis]